jgi:hypothetical protein
MFENRRWLVIPTSITSSINFNEVLESSPTTLRLSLDGAETFVKYDITEVTSSYTTEYVDAITGQTVSSSISAGIYGRPTFYSSSYSEYDHQEILDLLTGSNWTSPLPPTTTV